MLVYPADRITEIEESEKLGIKADIREIDFGFIMQRMRDKVENGRNQMKRGVSQTKELGFYEGTARFLSENTLEINGEKIKSDKIFLAVGVRPHIPSIKGIEDVPYITNETVLQLDSLPESMIIVGGGDIAAEYAHFFSAMRTRITVIQRNMRLVPSEEPEISSLLKAKLNERMEILTGIEVESVSLEGTSVKVICINRKTGEKRQEIAEKLFIAAGRISNADLLDISNAGITTNEKGFVEVDSHFRTSNRNIWAFGDVLGRYMYRHVANRQALFVWHNALHSEKMEFDYNAVPYAVFTHPQIASVGLKEHEALKGRKPSKLLVGRASYNDVAMGEAMEENDGFAKAIVDGPSGRILGFHIIGPQASSLIQEVINIMAFGGDVNVLGRGMHIHPALPELIISTLNNLRPSTL